MCLVWPPWREFNVHIEICSASRQAHANAADAGSRVRIATSRPYNFFTSLLESTMKLLVLYLLALSVALPAAAAELKVDLGHGVMTYRTEALLKRHDARTINVPADVAFGHAMQYRAVPLAALLKDIAPGDHLQFVASDGFAAEIPAALVLNHRGSEAWLAIEDPARPWPVLSKDNGHAGPFYVVWTQPQATHVSPEQWPYQLATIRKLDSVAARFPMIVPAPSLPSDSEVERGFAVFQHTCFACHTLNGQGDAKLGPDLNIPHNPTEYLRDDLLRAFVRNPQSLRQWPQAKMQGFDTQALSDADLDAVLAYLHYMANQKIGSLSQLRSSVMVALIGLPASNSCSCRPRCALGSFASARTLA
jgi:Cytochrome c, mono- and diheme variants